jgi:hypothetical protein
MYSHIEAFLDEWVEDVRSHMVLDNGGVTPSQDVGCFKGYIIQHKGTDDRIHRARTKLLQIVDSWKTDNSISSLYSMTKKRKTNLLNLH